jgi:hypothetical protein
MFIKRFQGWLVALAVVLAVALASHFGFVGHDHSITLMAFGGIMTNAGVRVFDPVLSNVAQGYRNAEFVGNILFPRVPVFATGGQIIEFGKEAFYNYNLRRTPGGSTKRIQFGYLGKPYALLQDSIEAQVPREWLRDAAVVPGIDLGTRAVGLGMKIVTKSLEVDQATMATTAGNYDANHKVVLAGATKWSTATGTPMTDVDTAREAIRAAVGIYPNVMLMSAVAFNACKNNPSIISRFQYNSSVDIDASQITTKMLAGLFNVDEVVVGKAIGMTDQGVSSDIWGNNVILAYTNLGSINAEEPSFGYTYTMEGNPLVEPTYWDPATKSWVYPVNFERVPVLSGITSGYLIQNPA